jgi:hypothetical protein
LVVLLATEWLIAVPGHSSGCVNDLAPDEPEAMVHWRYPSIAEGLHDLQACGHSASVLPLCRARMTLKIIRIVSAVMSVTLSPVLSGFASHGCEPEMADEVNVSALSVSEVRGARLPSDYAI